MSTDSPYCVLSWEDAGDPTDALYTARTIYVRHEIGQAVTRQMVIDQFTADVGYGRYVAGRYRIYPASSVVDVTVKATVEVAA